MRTGLSQCLVLKRIVVVLPCSLEVVAVWSNIPYAKFQVALVNCFILVRDAIRGPHESRTSVKNPASEFYIGCRSHTASASYDAQPSAYRQDVSFSKTHQMPPLPQIKSTTPRGQEKTMRRTTRCWNHVLHGRTKILIGSRKGVHFVVCAI